MKIYIRLFILTFLLASCSSQKTISKKTMEEYQQKGYTLGTLESKKTGDCSWVIVVKDSNLQFDPVNIDEDKFVALKATKAPFFFKFLRLRRQNRCEGVSPIQLTEIVDNP